MYPISENNLAVSGVIRVKLPFLGRNYVPQHKQRSVKVMVTILIIYYIPYVTHYHVPGNEYASRV